MFARDVRDGLSRPEQKELSCQYFYDEVGSALFEAITVLPEYGLTRADTRLIRHLAPELSGYLRAPVTVAELGSGSGSKTRWILEALARAALVKYYPIDVSGTALNRCAQELAPVATVVPLQASYLEGLRQAVCARRGGHALLVLFLGSTIGNFERGEAQEFLCQVRGCLMPGDALLLGADLIKEKARMILAYDDPAGVTAAFNLNLLGRINRELGGGFDLRAFAHEARWNDAHERIEMHLRSTVTQRVAIATADMECQFLRGESIRTECCHKFRAREIREMAARASFECVAQWIDEDWPFTESLLVV